MLPPQNEEHPSNKDGNTFLKEALVNEESVGGSVDVVDVGSDGVQDAQKKCISLSVSSTGNPTNTRMPISSGAEETNARNESTFPLACSSRSSSSVRTRLPLVAKEQRDDFFPFPDDTEASDVDVASKPALSPSTPNNPNSRVGCSVRRLLLDPPAMGSSSLSVRTVASADCKSTVDKHSLSPLTVGVENVFEYANSGIEDQISTMLAAATVVFESSSSSSTTTDDDGEEEGQRSSSQKLSESGLSSDTRGLINDISCTLNRGRSGSTLSSCSTKPRWSGLGWTAWRRGWRGIVPATRSCTPSHSRANREDDPHLGEEEEDIEEDTEPSGTDDDEGGGGGGGSKVVKAVASSVQEVEMGLNRDDEEKSRDEDMLNPLLNLELPNGLQEGTSACERAASPPPPPSSSSHQCKEEGRGILYSSVSSSTAPSWVLKPPSSFRCGQLTEHHERYTRFVKHYFGLNEEMARREAKYMRTTYASAVRLVQPRRESRRKRRDGAGGSTALPPIIATQDLPRHSSVAVEGDYLFSRLMKRAEFLAVTREYMAAAAAFRSGIVGSNADEIGAGSQDRKRTNNNSSGENRNEVVGEGPTEVVSTERNMEKRRWWWSALLQTDVRLSHIVALADSIERRTATAASGSSTNAVSLDTITGPNSSPVTESNPSRLRGAQATCASRKASIKTGVSPLKPNARCIILHYGFPCKEEEEEEITVLCLKESGMNREKKERARRERNQFPSASLMAVVTTRSVQQGEEIVVSLPSYYRCMDEPGWYEARYAGRRNVPEEEPDRCEEEKPSVTASDHHSNTVADGSGATQTIDVDGATTMVSPQSLSPNYHVPSSAYGCVSDFTKGIKYFSMWPSETRFYHGIGHRHASEFPQASFPFTLLDLKENRAIGPGELGVYASAFIPYGTCFLYGGSVATTEDVALFMAKRRDPRRSICSATSTDPPVTTSGDHRPASEYATEKHKNENSGNTENSSRQSKAPRTNSAKKHLVTGESDKQEIPSETERLACEDLSDDTYALGLDDNTMCYGQGLARYINHRYNLSAFGNVELCSLSIPMISYHYGNERTTSPVVLNRSDSVDAWNSNASQSKKSNNSSSPLLPSAIPACSSPTSSGRPSSTKGKGRRRIHGLGHNADLPTSSTNSSSLTVMNVKPNMISIPFFMTTTDVAAGAELLAWTYGEEYDARLERVAVADGHLVPYMDAEMLNRRCYTCVSGTEEENTFLPPTQLACTKTPLNLDGIMETHHVYSAKTTDMSHECASGMNEYHRSASPYNTSFPLGEQGCSFSRKKSCSSTPSQHFFQRYKGDYRYGLRVGDVVWRRGNCRCCQWRQPPHALATCATRYVEQYRAGRQDELDLFVVLDTQLEGAEYVLLRRLERRKLSVKELVALLTEVEVVDDDQQEMDERRGMKRERNMDVDDMDDDDDGPWAKVKKNEGEGIIKSGFSGRGRPKGGDNHQERPRSNKRPGRPRKASVQDRFAVLELSEMDEQNVKGLNAPRVEAEVAHNGVWDLAVSSTVSLALLQPDVDYVDISDEAIVSQWKPPRNCVSSPSAEPAKSAVQRRILVPLVALRRRTKLARASPIVAPPLLHGNLWALMKGGRRVRSVLLDGITEKEHRRKRKRLKESEDEV